MKKKLFCILLCALLCLLGVFSGCKRELTEQELARYAEIDAAIAEPHKDGEITVVPKDGVTVEQLAKAFAELELPADFEDPAAFPFCSDRVVVQYSKDGSTGKLPQLWFSMAVSEDEMRETLFALSGCELIERAYPSAVYSEARNQSYIAEWTAYVFESGIPEWVGKTAIEKFEQQADERLEYAHKEDTLTFRYDSSEDFAAVWEFFERFCGYNDFSDEAVFGVQYREGAMTYYEISVKVSPEELRDKLILAIGLEETVYPDYS